MSETIDRRTLRTKKALKNAMLDLLKKKDITKITVAELTERADIGRGTFYLHYADPYDLLDKIEDEVVEQITVFYSPTSDDTRYFSLLTHLERVWQYVYENKDVFTILMNHQDGMRFMKKFRAHCEKVGLEAAGIDASASLEKSFNIIYVTSGTLGIFQKWMESGAMIPPNQLAQIVRRAIGGGE